MTQPRSLALLALLAMAGCATTETKPIPVPPPEPKAEEPGAVLGVDPEDIDDESGDGDDTPTAPDAGAAPPKRTGKRKGPEVGPKIMGYDHKVRLSYGLLRGTYNDAQKNESTGNTAAQSGVSLSGSRFIVEHYPLLYEGDAVNQYLYSMFEFRSEKPDADYWSKRQTALVSFGYVLPFMRMISPLIGLHVEFNKISLASDDSPEVAKSDIRAYILGADFRQKIWGTGTWLAVFYQGRVHSLNLTLPNKGLEAEIGIGAAFRYFWFRTEASLDHIYQSYKAKRQSEDDGEQIEVNSRYRAWVFTGTLWI